MSNGPILTLGKDRTRGVSVFDLEANPKLLEQLIDMGFEKSVFIYESTKFTKYRLLNKL